MRARSLGVVQDPDEITRHRQWNSEQEADVFVDGGPTRGPIDIVEYDPSWPATFERVAATIRDALGDRVLEMEHIGSTSVPGLSAKPVIDIDLVVVDSADEAAYLPTLEAVGFRLSIREPDWHEHRCLVADDPRTNLHVFSPDCPEVTRHRLFRDWLRSHPDDLARYQEVKVAAAAASTAAGEHVMEYNQRKEPVILDIYDRMFRAAGLR